MAGCLSHHSPLSLIGYGSSKVDLMGPGVLLCTSLILRHVVHSEAPSSPLRSVQQLHESLSLNSLAVCNQMSFDSFVALDSVCCRLAFLQGLFWSFAFIRANPLQKVLNPLSEVVF